MKLLSFYSDLILEAPSKLIRVGKPIIYNNKKYLIYQTKHQFEVRGGFQDGITSSMWDMIQDETYKSGIPSNLIWESISKNLPKILNSFDNLNRVDDKGRKRLLFVEKKFINKGSKVSYFYFEYVLDYIQEKYDRKLVMVTSSISPEGKYLEFKKNGADKILLEHLGFVDHLKVIIL
jgi:hypothetical protein